MGNPNLPALLQNVSCGGPVVSNIWQTLTVEVIIKDLLGRQQADLITSMDPTYLFASCCGITGNNGSNVGIVDELDIAYTASVNNGPNAFYRVDVYAPGWGLSTSYKFTRNTLLGLHEYFESSNSLTYDVKISFG